MTRRTCLYSFIPACSLTVICIFAALWQRAVGQGLITSSCVTCVAMNGVSIYSDVGGGKSVQDPQSRGVYSTGIGIPTVVWCSADPTGNSGNCSNTSFIVANLKMQCSGWEAANPAQKSPCPASTPYAFFSSVRLLAELRISRAGI